MSYEQHLPRNSKPVYQQAAAGAWLLPSAQQKSAEAAVHVRARAAACLPHLHSTRKDREATRKMLTLQFITQLHLIGIIRAAEQPADNAPQRCHMYAP